MAIKIFLIEDHKLMRYGLKHLISSTVDIEVVKEFNEATTVLEEIPKHKPDILVSDIMLPGISGLDLVRKVRSDYPDIKVIILSMFKDEEHIKEAVDIGVEGYLHKDIFEDELIEAIHKVKEGEKYYSRVISQVILDKLVNGTKKKTLLTKRELQVLKLIADGLTNKDIAEKLEIASKTVDKHRANMITKLEVKNTAELIKLAVKKEII